MHTPAACLQKYFPALHLHSVLTNSSFFKYLYVFILLYYKIHQKFVAQCASSHDQFYNDYQNKVGTSIIG